MRPIRVGVSYDMIKHEVNMKRFLSVDIHFLLHCTKKFSLIQVLILFNLK